MLANPGLIKNPLLNAPVGLDVLPIGPGSCVPLFGSHLGSEVGASWLDWTKKS